MDGDLSADCVLAFLAVCWVAFQALKVHGRLYGARTERLRMRSDAYYAAAHRALANGELDHASFDLVSRVAGAVGRDGPAWPWVKASMQAGPVVARAPMPSGLARDLAESSLAGMMFLAEVRPVAGWFLRRRVARLARSTDDVGFVLAMRSWATSAAPRDPWPARV